jgi:hypothetical protein
MHAEEIRIGHPLGPIVVEVEGSFPDSDNVFEVEFPRRGAGGRILVVHNGRPHAVVSLGSLRQEVDRLADSTVPTISWARLIDRHTALIETRAFDSELRLGDQHVCVPDEVALDLCEHLGTPGLDNPLLLDEFVLPDLGGGARFLVAKSPSEENFNLIGRTCLLRVSTTNGLRAVDVTRTPLAAQNSAIHLATGSLTLSDAPPRDSVLLSGLAVGTAPMFDLWDTYSRLELDEAHKRADAIGQARHGNPAYKGDLVVLPIRAREDEDFLIQLSRERSNTEVEIVPASIGFDIDRRSLERFIGEVDFVDVGGRTITVRLRSDRPTGAIPKDGFVRLHIGGAAAQASRRQDVYQRLRTGNYAIAALGPILREDRPPLAPRTKHRISLTDAVRKVVPGSITPAQQRAIDIAINTPDIALIQGPPGTGKSQIIAAIQQRLAELSPSGTSRLILLTSAQHDAVDLVATRTLVFGLPPKRINPKRAELENPIDKWRRERIAALQRYSATRGKSSISRYLGEVLEAYRKAPYRSVAAADLLDEVLDRCGGQLNADLRTRMEARAASLRRQKNRSRLVSDISAVRALRITPDGHGDDGPSRAERLLHRSLTTVEDWDSKFTPMLEQIAAGVEVDLAAVARMQSDLLDELLRAETVGGTALADQETQRLLAEAHAHVSGARDRPITPEEAVDLFILDLELDEHGVERTIGEYTAVWASTCQSSASLFVGDMTAPAENHSFPTVIVDEAARANPLDLLIPMVQAGERIILVGDHRQLPQLVDETLRIEVEERHGDTDVDLLDQSLFERLFRHLEHLELETGVPRAVTLDVQFRMHPTLGAFVSRTFYEPYGEGFTSGRPETDFAHGISRFDGKVAAWVDVPARSGHPIRRGTSLCRLEEAKVVAQLAAEILEEAPHLTVGIITFYAAQEDLILEELERFGITELTEQGVIISEPFRMIETSSGHREERIRVGTVDSFQGKEFDVVLLSLVRTGSVAADADTRRAFGFLASENRTCVALSRQRRLLVVVGDRAIVEIPQAQRVRGLLELAALCGEPT